MKCPNCKTKELTKSETDKGPRKSFIDYKCVVEGSGKDKKGCGFLHVMRKSVKKK